MTRKMTSERSARMAAVHHGPDFVVGIDSARHVQNLDFTESAQMSGPE